MSFIACLTTAYNFIWKGYPENCKDSRQNHHKDQLRFSVRHGFLALLQSNTRKNNPKPTLLAIWMRRNRRVKNCKRPSARNGTIAARAQAGSRTARPLQRQWVAPWRRRSRSLRREISYLKGKWQDLTPYLVRTCPERWWTFHADPDFPIQASQACTSSAIFLSVSFAFFNECQVENRNACRRVSCNCFFAVPVSFQALTRSSDT